jgi:hypothetical protein
MGVNITKAHELTGASRTTIYKHIRNGRLSALGNKKDGFEIEVAELNRVYGLKKQEEEGASSNVQSVQGSASSLEGDRESEGQTTVVQNAVLRKELEETKDKLARERVLYEARIERSDDEIENLRHTLKSSQDQQMRLTAVLTDQRQDKDRNEKNKMARQVEFLIKKHKELESELAQRQRGFLERWLGIGKSKKRASVASRQRKTA